MASLLKADNLTKIYGSDQSEVRALDGVSLEILEGEMLVILGSSGSGKSTLLNILGGMDQPNSGRLTFQGRDISRLGDRGRTEYRRKNIGFIFQAFNLIPELTVRENVSLTADARKNPNIVDETIRMMGLESKMDAYPSQLSGGQQQRVSIARALAKESALLLCDEPTGALDYETGKQILIQLEALCRQQHKTIVIVTHTQEIGKMADRVLRMRNGKIVDQWSNATPEAAAAIEW